jgi:uncharacterized protein YqjF (DUF2071 family)
MGSIPENSQPDRSFLTAQWRDLIMINYRVDPQILSPWIPRGTSLDLWEGEALVSLVAFKFLDTRVLGCPVPWHRCFEEVNLRFYVVRETAQEYRRGVVFIREIVPKRMIAWVANTLYNEHYVALPMRHSGHTAPSTPTSLSYSWQTKRNRPVKYSLTSSFVQLPWRQGVQPASDRAGIRRVPRAERPAVA